MPRRSRSDFSAAVPFGVVNPALPRPPCVSLENKVVTRGFRGNNDFTEIIICMHMYIYMYIFIYTSI